jgi:hypothetical protein
MPPGIARPGSTPRIRGRGRPTRRRRLHELLLVAVAVDPEDRQMFGAESRVPIIAVADEPPDDVVVLPFGNPLKKINRRNTNNFTYSFIILVAKCLCVATGEKV